VTEEVNLENLGVNGNAIFKLSSKNCVGNEGGVDWNDVL
jgi:hypothetical protein